jgi:hypothetical protein
MATPRLPFLWPVLFKPLKVPRTSASNVTRRTPARRSFATTSCSRQDTIAQRYGTAHEPAPHLRDQEAQKGPEKEAKASPVPEPVEEEEEEESVLATMPSTQMKSADPVLLDEAAPPPPLDPPKAPDAKPLDTVLHMPSPKEEEERKPPHLKTPPYVHHFDTYSLVKDLTKSGFTEDQSVTVMKAVRGILTDNMDLARDGLVSKSNVENETYLFRAACSELRTEVGNTRNAEVQRMRSERNQLQHEVDILSQRMGQETSHLKDELKGLFDDRKMAVRNEQRYMESLVRVPRAFVAQCANAGAASTTGLQDHGGAELGCAQRSGGSEMDPDPESSHCDRYICLSTLHLLAVHELQQPPNPGAEEERRNPTRAIGQLASYRQAHAGEGRASRRRAAHHRRRRLSRIDTMIPLITQNPYLISHLQLMLLLPTRNFPKLLLRHPLEEAIQPREHLVHPLPIQRLDLRLPDQSLDLH